MIKRIFYIIIFFPLLLTSCATVVPKYSVIIDSIRSKQSIENVNCYIYPGFKDVSTDDLQFMEFSNYVKRMLTFIGLNVCEKVKDANIIVFLTYGIGEPVVHNYSYNIPVIGQTGYSSAYTSGSAFSFNKVTLYNATTKYTPTYGVVGNVNQQGSFTTYSRYIVLDAYDKNALMANKSNRELWKTKIVSSGTNPDLREMFPILIAASLPYVAEDTEEMIQVNIDDTDDIVPIIKGDMAIEKDTFANLGDYCFEKDDISTANRYYQLALKANPNMPSILFRIATALRINEGKNNAEKYFLKAINLNKEYIDLHKESEDYVWDDGPKGSGYDKNKILNIFLEADKIDSGELSR